MWSAMSDPAKEGDGYVTFSYSGNCYEFSTSINTLDQVV